MERITNAMEKLEKLASAGKIKSFLIRFEQEGLLVEVAAIGMSQLFRLPENTMVSIHDFFSDVTSITYPSFDYDNLICLLRAQQQ